MTDQSIIFTSAIRQRNERRARPALARDLRQAYVADAASCGWWTVVQGNARPPRERRFSLRPLERRRSAVDRLFVERPAGEHVEVDVLRGRRLGTAVTL